MTRDDAIKVGLLLGELERFDNTEFSISLFRQAIGNDKGTATDAAVDDVKRRMNIALLESKNAVRKVLVDDLRALGVEIDG